MAKQEEVKPDHLSLQKTDQPVLVTGDEILEKYYSEEFKTKYSQDDSQITRNLSLQIEKNCTLETFPKQNRNIIIHVHGEKGEITIDRKLYHPTFIASQIQAESSKEWPLVLDIYACRIGRSIASEKKDKKYEDKYRKELPNNCLVILNGGNKKSITELNTQEVERVIDKKDYQKNVYIRFVRKIFHNPQTIKLVYKNEKGKTSFFKHSALKLEDGQKATIENIKKWTIEGANKFKEDFLKEIDDLKEQERIKLELEDEIARLTAELDDAKVIELAEKTLLIEAHRGKAERVEHYLTEDFNLNYYTVKEKLTPLYIAVENGHIEVVRVLLKNGANPNLARSIEGCTPLIMATYNGDIGLVKLLLKNGADPNQTSTVIEYNPAMVAILKQDIEITKLLIEKTDLDKNIWKSKTIEVLIEEKITNESSKQELLEAVQKRREEQNKSKKSRKRPLPPSSEVYKAKVPKYDLERAL